MKKQVKIPVIVASSIVGAILIAVIVLCCIVVHPMDDFMQYATVRVTTSAHELPNGSLADESQPYKKKIDVGLEDTGFSVMHAMLEFVGSYGPEFTVDDEDERQVVTIAEARSACAATDSSYMLELGWKTEQKIKVEKETVVFDRLLMNVKTTDGELRWVTVYLFRSDLDGADNPEADEYTFAPVRMRMNTSPLYIALGEIAAEYGNRA